jgi:hypothetical protein
MKKWCEEGKSSEGKDETIGMNSADDIGFGRRIAFEDWGVRNLPSEHTQICNIKSNSQISIMSHVGLTL